jgi:hypothetical protein
VADTERAEHQIALDRLRPHQLEPGVAEPDNQLIDLRTGIDRRPFQTN